MCFMGFWIRISNFMLFVVNGLIKGGDWETKWPVPRFDCDESLTWRGLNSNPRHFSGSTTFSYSCGESRLLVSCCAGDRCGMAGSNEDRGRNRRPGAEDRGWSYRSGTWWLDDREIGWRCGLHRARGDEEREFFGWASKPRSTVCQWFDLKTTRTVYQWFDLKTTGTIYQWFDLKTTGTIFSGLALKPVAMVSSYLASKPVVSFLVDPQN
jgi:hypothetical protein